MDSKLFINAREEYPSPGMWSCSGTELGKILPRSPIIINPKVSQTKEVYWREVYITLEVTTNYVNKMVSSRITGEGLLRTKIVRKQKCSSKTSILFYTILSQS